MTFDLTPAQYTLVDAPLVSPVPSSRAKEPTPPARKDRPAERWAAMTASADVRFIS